jgi:MerR family transcriptional regulator, heat shock protein HspR
LRILLNDIQFLLLKSLFACGKEVDIYKCQIFTGELKMDDNYDTPLYPISVAAKILNISVHTLRMYEREGLIIPFKKESSHRLYSQFDIDRLKCIRKAISELKLSINGIKAIYSLTPCWKIVGCSNNDQMICEAYNSHSKPCWVYQHNYDSCKNRECRQCTVYKDFADCHSIKASIIEFIQKKEPILKEN